MAKIKLLFDVEQLSVSGGRGTGIVRVCDELLRALLKKKEIEVFFLITGKSGDFDAYLKTLGAESLKSKIVYLPKLKSMTKSLNVWQSLRAKILTRFYKKRYLSCLNKYDAYLSLFSPIAPIVYQSRLKTFMFVHDLIPIYYPNGCDKKFVQKFTGWIKNAHPDLFFVISEYTKRDLIRFKKDENLPVKTVYLGADKKFMPNLDADKKEAVKAKYGIRTKKYFLAVSEITARKNLVHLLRAFSLFLTKTGATDISLVLTGPKRLGYEALTQEVNSLAHYKDKINQTGFVLESDLPFLYQGARAFIYPSLYEGFGLPVLEAMQTGTPVISADNTSLPEVGGEAVYYITALDIEETAEALTRLYQDDALAMHLKKKGLKQAQKFSWQTFFNQVADEIKHSVKGEKND